VGVIGAGNISPQYLSHLSTYPDVKIVAISDLIVERADARAEEYGIPTHGVDVVYGNDDDQTSFDKTAGLLSAHPNLKGIISPDDRRHHRLGSLPVDVERQGQGLPDWPRHPEPDASVRQGRHRHRVRPVEPG